MSTSPVAIVSGLSGPAGSCQRAGQLSAPARAKALIFTSTGAIDPSAIPSAISARSVASISRLRARMLAALAGEWIAGRLRRA